VTILFVSSVYMPGDEESRQENDDTQLTNRIGQLENQIEAIKARLSDDTKIEQLNRRIAHCESLAGITDEKNEDVKFE